MERTKFRAATLHFRSSSLSFPSLRLGVSAVQIPFLGSSPICGDPGRTLHDKKGVWYLFYLRQHSVFFDKLSAFFIENNTTPQQISSFSTEFPRLRPESSSMIKKVPDPFLISERLFCSPQIGEEPFFAPALWQQITAEKFSYLQCPSPLNAEFPAKTFVLALRK